jgi:hypothetical protein
VNPNPTRERGNACILKKYTQYSLWTFFGAMLLIATGMAIWSWNADQERIRITETWNRCVDQFEKLQTKYHQPITEVEILVRLMRQNPQHSLWKEFEFTPVFSGEKFAGLFAPHLSWPQKTIQLGDESVHVLTSQHPCNSRKLVVHTDSASRILDFQVAHGIHMIESMELTVTSLKPHPVIRVACWDRYNSNDPPIVNNLKLTKSITKAIDPKSITIINRQER